MRDPGFLLTGLGSLISSEAIIEEISAIPDTTKRLRVEKVIILAKKEIVVDDGIVARMHELMKKGGAAMDSLHIACAEHAGALLLTTDDDLIILPARIFHNVEVYSTDVEYQSTKRYTRSHSSREIPASRIISLISPTLISVLPWTGRGMIFLVERFTIR